MLFDLAEIRERIFTPYKALEYLVYAGGPFQESWKFHGARPNEYPTELAKRREWFQEDGGSKTRQFDRVRPLSPWKRCKVARSLP